MSNNILPIAFLWHFHQPVYKNSHGNYHLPWLRFHATRDYLNFARLLERFPRIRQNVNLVPGMLLQLQDYAANEARDNIWILSERPVAQLDTTARQAILENFFISNVETMIRPWPRYYELYKRYSETLQDLPLAQRVAHFSDQDFIDLQVWYNLSWFGRMLHSRPLIERLLERGRDFRPEDVLALLAESRRVISEIVPAYQKLWESGQVELSTSPMYHPLLPLLIDSDVAHVSSPQLQLPATRVQLIEDADNQIRLGLAAFEGLFGRRPDGVWPPEGAVSDDAAQLISRHKIRWIASDEAILSRSLGEEELGQQLYRPHLFKGSSRSIILFFRDNHLSDNIGYVYSSWDAGRAVNDFISRLHHIRNSIIAESGEKGLADHLVTIILDGENSWEHYPESCTLFLQTLFERLSEDDLLQTCTFGDFLDRQPVLPELTHLHPGSWVNANFDIWIGSGEDNRAWELLQQTRRFLLDMEGKGVLPDNLKQQAWRQIYIAEGSDWCWWYGDAHTSYLAPVFDQLFREHLICVYEICGSEAPAALYQPIKRTHHDELSGVHPQGPVSPTIDGFNSHREEWQAAAIYECHKDSHDSMRRTARIMEKLYVGFDEQKLYLRVDFAKEPDMLLEYVLGIKTPRKITIVMSPLRGVCECFETIDDVKKKTTLQPEFYLSEVFEAAVKLADIGLQPGDAIGFQFLIKLNRQHVEVFPHHKLIELTVGR